MKFDIIALALVTAVFVAALAGCNWLLATYAPARSAVRPMAAILRVVALASVLLGSLIAVYGWINIQTAIAKIGPVRFEITAPSYAEVLVGLAVGMFVAAVALAFTVAARWRAGAA